jgi:hypothetical protein
MAAEPRALAAALMAVTRAARAATIEIDRQIQSTQEDAVVDPGDRHCSRLSE